MRFAVCRTRRTDRCDLIGARSRVTSTQACPRTALRLQPLSERSRTMVVLGIDAHKRTHTAVAVDEHGKRLGSTTVSATSAGNLELVRWAGQFGEHTFAVEDCRHLSRRLERDLLAAGETLVRVHPKLMARVRRSAREQGKSDPIDATSVARAAQREENLPTATLDGPERDLRLLVDHREDL